MASQLITGFSKEETKKIEKHLLKLLPYLSPGKFVIVGGIAIRHHLLAAGKEYPQRPFNDLDIIAESFDVVNKDIKEDFLTYHFHQKDETFYFAFVDVQTKTKVDIFDYEKPPLGVTDVSFENRLLQIASIEDQLGQTVFDIQRISEENKVDPKQFQDAKLLSQIADLNTADKFWKKKRNPEHPESILDAIKRAEKIRQDHPEWIKQSPFRKEAWYKCPSCVKSKDFPVEPMDRIYKVLGYVE